MVERSHERGVPTLQVDRRGAAGSGGSRPRQLRSQYRTARAIAYILAFLGWIAVVVGIIIAIVGAGAVLQYSDVPAITLLWTMAPGLGTAWSGLLMVALAQVTRAIADNADHTHKILELIQSRI